MKTITLLTDFGLKDPYVGIMKVVILSINPDVRIVDITHDMEPQDIREGAFLLKEYYQYFPRDSIHVAIVDPTVGSNRRALILYKDGHVFVGPDNGIFSLLIESDTESYMITNRDFMLKQISPSFHGRDVFAPIAAHVAYGIHPSVLGEKVIDLVCLTNIYPDIINAVLTGEVVRFDRFGNAITNIDVETFNDFTGGKDFRVHIGDMDFASLHKSYYEQDFTCLAGSSGYLEFGYYKGSFKDMTGARKGEEVSVKLFEL